jgi:hypothetical protein
MRNNTIAWFLGGLLARAGPIWAQDVPKAGDENTVKKDDVKTWILHLDGRGYAAHPATPAYEGGTGLFQRLPALRRISPRHPALGGRNPPRS